MICLRYVLKLLNVTPLDRVLKNRVDRLWVYFFIRLNIICVYGYYSLELQYTDVV